MQSDSPAGGGGVEPGSGLALSAAEVTAPHPCEVAPGEFDHDWEFQDDSFDHEYGCEQVHYWACTRCDATRDMEPGDYDFDD